MADKPLTLTIRLYDPTEKQDPAKSASWATVEIAREDLGMARAAFFEKYVSPALDKLIQLKLT